MISDILEGTAQAAKHYRLMAAPINQDEYYDETPTERIGRCWKNAANMYHRACTSDSVEVRDFYMQIAMAWAAMADQFERTPLPPNVMVMRDRPTL